MANRLINQMGLPRSIANIFAARNINTAKVMIKLRGFSPLICRFIHPVRVKYAIIRNRGESFASCSSDEQLDTLLPFKFLN